MASTTRGTFRNCMMSLALGAAFAASASAQFNKDNGDIGAPEGGPVLLGTSFTYQGRLLDSGSLLNGPANLTFTLYDQPAGGLQIGAVNSFPAEPIDEGLFIVTLDFGGGAFTIIERWLEISVNAVPLAPRQLVHSAPVAQYALNADGAMITNISASNLTSGILPSARLSGTYSNALNFSNNGNTLRGTSLNIDTNGFNTNNGRVGINKVSTQWNIDILATTSAGLGLRLARPGGSRIALSNTSGGSNAKSWGIDTSGITPTSLNFHALADGEITILNTPLQLFRDGDVEVQTQLRLGTDLTMQGTAGGTATFFQSDDDLGVTISANSSQVSTWGSDGLEQIRLWGGSWGEVLLYDSSVTNDNTVVLSATGNSGGQLSLRNSTGAFVSGVLLEGATTEGGGGLSLRETDGTTIFEFNATDAFSTGGDFFAYNNAGGLVFDFDTGSSTPFVQLLDGSGTSNNSILFTTSSGGVISLRNSSGATTITLDGDFGGDGRVTTQELSITGGSDLSEQFDVRSGDFEPEPGMVVCIDTDNIGKLVVSEGEYDRTVAGIISGAGGIKTGMMMGQEGSIADGEYPVALTGRVYVMCDTANGPIEPGDLLTTSDVPGHAMKVTDYQAAQGAIIGKAMSRLDSADGRGLVLVLVTLQ
ncbi:MAG: hypothetical protein O7G85_11025 [Planctomycetota bacterium]|nr:hypothetical protein [Planctomycetota bacterium]